MPIPDLSCGRNTLFGRNRHCAVILFLQVPKECTDLDLILSYILISDTYCTFARERNFLAPRGSAFRIFAASGQDPVYITSDELFRFHNNDSYKMPCKLDSTVNPRSFDKSPHPPLLRWQDRFYEV